jgi:transcriptional regulator of acetoin/glycerol metabolism
MAHGLSSPRPNSLLVKRRKVIDRAWLAYIEDGVEPEGLSAEIVRSWRRARESFGVDPTIRRALRSLPEGDLTERRRRDPVYRLAEPVLEEFAQRLGSVHHVLAYFDAAGWMLSLQGHPGVIEGVSDINFAPGACWAEESAGTNGPGTAIREGRPVEVFASEHFVAAWQTWSCAGAPIFRPGEATPVGLVDITGPWEIYSPQALLLAKAIARNVEARLAQAHAVRDEVIRFAFRSGRGSSDPLLAVDTEGRILAANPAAAARIGLPSGRLPTDLRDIVDPLRAASPQADRVVEWRDLRLLSQPVLHDGCPVGSVLRALAPPAAPAPLRGRAAPRPAAPVRWSFDKILSECGALEAPLEVARVASRNALPVVISGESGTGKELFAQAIHGASARAAGPFVAVNCGSIPAPLLEAELFGYEAGAFTGGRKDGNAGKFEEASGGTLFLDEVSELSPQGQTALLRILQEREIVRLGGSTPRRVDVRIVAATNRELRPEVAARRFRQDLYYRLDVLSLAIPPLRQRVEDVPLLAQAFLEQAEAEVGRTGLRLSDEAVAALQGFTWPGNVRQLQNVILRAAAMAPGNEILASHLPAEISRTVDNTPRPAAPAGDGPERQALGARLERHAWNVARAAAELGVSRMTLYRRMQRFGLERPRP